MTPKGWMKVSLASLSTVQTGIAKGKLVISSPISLPYLRVANVQDGRVDLTDIKDMTVSRADLARYSLRFGDVLFTEGGDFDKLGRGTVWRGQIEPCLHQNHVFAVRPDPTLLLPDFLAYQAASDYGRRYFQRSAKQSTNLASINSTQLKDFPILLPPLTEQHKIVEILHTLDKTLEKLKELLKREWELYSGYVNRFINNPRYERQILRGHLRQLMNRNSQKKINIVLSVTNSEGFVLPERVFAHRIASNDLSNYKIVQRGQYAYNPSRINVGSIARLDRWTEGVISPMYVVFQVNSSLNSDFFHHWLSSAEGKQRVRLAAQGSVRDSVSFDDLCSIAIPVPSLDRQQKVVKFINESSRKIELVQKLMVKYQNYKKGLMQKLMIGEWRVDTVQLNP